MKAALERLRELIDSEERLVIAVTYSATQQTSQTVGKMDQKLELTAKTVNDIRASQQSE